jgi:uncharacterized integral membrane protein
MSNQPTFDTEPAAPSGDPLRRSRTSRTWLGLNGSGLVLVLLIIFIAQNTQRVQVTFLGWSWHAPLAVALLIAAAAAIIVTAIAGTLRIVQLRRRVRRDKKHRH